ncbi:MAG: IMPACT family protein [Eubacterium sp.]|jgi:uncharacterized YigZ family protein
METLYFTAAKQAKAEITVERSKFIAAAAHVEGREDAERFIASVREKYRDATHNVPAFVVGEKSEIKMASDDGEPPGTAGAQVLRIIENRGLTFTAIVVTRYFGGKKLGTGGLSRAYSEAAALALDAAGKALAVRKDRLFVSCDYSDFGRLKRTKALAGADIRHEEYGTSVSFELICGAEDSERFAAVIRDATAGKAKIEHREIFVDLEPYEDAR